MERIDDLQTRGLRIIQDTDLFCFSTDAVLLADFATPRPHERVADLGAGTGILDLLMYARQPTATFAAFELQKPLYELLKRNVDLNRLQGLIQPYLGDIKDIAEYWTGTRFDMCVCNPPYEKSGSGAVPPNAIEAAARFEINVTMQDICRCASRLLSTGGRFYLCIRPERLTEVSSLLAEQKLEPKHLRFVHARQNRNAKLCLIEARKGGRPGLRVGPPLVLYEEDGTESTELQAIYNRIP